MALLSAAARAALLCGCALLGSCAQSAPLGHVEVWLRDGDRIDSEFVQAQAFIDPSVSRYTPHGFYAYAELPRADGSVGVFEIDVPTDAPEDSGVPRFVTSYRELEGEHVRFASEAVRGQLIVPSDLDTASDTGCACEDSGFAMTFVDPGADGVLDTDDDRLRRLMLGRMGWAEDFCRPKQDLAVPDELRVSVDRCRPAVDASETETETESESESLPCLFDCYEYEPDPVVVSGGCDADDGSDEDYYASDQGCGSSTDYGSSDTTDYESSDTSASGCEGDTTDDDSSGACEGDSADDDEDTESSSCTVGRAHAPAHRPRRSSAFAGTGLPLLAAVLWLSLRARRLRA